MVIDEGNNSVTLVCSQVSKSRPFDVAQGRLWGTPTSAAF